jgi:hypothetical protein
MMTKSRHDDQFEAHGSRGLTRVWGRQGKGRGRRGGGVTSAIVIRRES